MVNKEKRKCKREYFMNKFEKVKGNLKNTWKVINEVLNKGNKKSKCQSIHVGDKTLEDTQDIANEFNKYFNTVGTKIVENLSGSNVHYKTYLKKKNHKCMYFRPITATEILDIVNAFDSNKSPGSDDIHPNVFKKSVVFILKPLCNIFNSSLEKGIFPQSLKRAKIIPVYKKGEHNKLNNYRPISLLSIFSKTFEKLVYNRLISFLDKNNILYKRQFGFRKGYSTYMALIEFTNKIAEVFEKGEVLLGIFLDLSKAFDCIDHNILLSKLEHYGIHGIVLQWFKSYLENRTQYTSMENSMSDELFMQVGVPQGSVLGPLLFLIFINDLEYVSTRLFSIIFADDTNLFISGNDIDEMNREINSEMSKVYNWFSANKLVLNLEKTCYMIFKPKNKQICDSAIKNFVGNYEIQRVNCTKFLGIQIDANLTWKEHVDDICIKISRTIGVMNRLKETIPQRILITLYNTMILPYISYCNIIWGNCALNLLHRILVLQKRAIRIINNVPPLAHTDLLFTKFKVLKVKDINKLQIAIFMYSYFSNRLPQTFKNIFTSNSAIHSHSTRISKNIRLPLYKYNFSRTTIKYTGAKNWNRMTTELKNSKSLSQFKYKYKNFLFET